MKSNLLENLLDDRKFSDLCGSEFVEAVLEPAYEETRYPVPSPLHLNFKIRNGWYQYPIAASDIGQFARALADIVLTHLGQSGRDFSGLRAALDSLFDSSGGRRFVNVAFGGSYADKFQA